MNVGKTEPVTCTKHLVPRALKEWFVTGDTLSCTEPRKMVLIITLIYSDPALTYLIELC